jgi:tRNA(Ile)-lysidine synthase
MDALDRLGYDLIIAHLNHGIRPEAAGEADRVRQAAESRGFSFVLEERDTSAYAQAENLSLEEAARELRYVFLFEQAQIHGVEAVAVGHNADDQVETVLMHWLRGAGFAGLKGIRICTLPNPWSEAIPLVRPLLSVWGDEIRAYCQERGLEPIFDPSNLDPSYFRNRLRHELIPLLDDYVPGIRHRLWQMAEIIAGDHAVLSAVVDEAWNDCLLEEGERFVAFDAGELTNQPLGVKRRLIRRAVALLRPDIRDLGFEAVERALDALEQPGQVGNLALDVNAFREEDHFYLLERCAVDALPSRQWPQLLEGVDRIEIVVPGEIALPGDWQLHAAWVEDVESAWDEVIINENPYQAWIMLPKRDPADLALRSRRRGDRFQPLGMEGHQVKISDFMIDQKIPRRARERWPLVCVGDQIAWVVGLRLSERFRVERPASPVVHFRLSRKA